MSANPDSNPTYNGHSFVILLKWRIRACFLSEPAVFCFIQSIFWISASLAILGIYIKGGHRLPDLDTMKNWNAYGGKLGESDYCFQASSSTSKTQLQSELLHQYCSTPSVSKSGNCSTIDKPIVFATVGANLSFTLHQHFVNQSEGIVSTFSGKDIGAKIKEQTSQKRIEECIGLAVWIPFDVNITQACVKDQCTFFGCLLITAPLTAVPTRIPQVHEDFTFATKVFNSKRKPGECVCRAQLPGKSNLQKVDLHRGSNCSASNQPVVKLLTGHRWNAKGYGVIRVDLSEDEKRIASYHLCLTALALACLGLALTVAVISTAPAAVEKKCQA